MCQREKMEKKIPCVFITQRSLKKYLFLAALGLCCWVQTFASCCEEGLLSSCGGRFLIVVASLVEHRLWGTQASVVVAYGLSSCASPALEHISVVVVHWLSCPVAFGIFQDQRSNWCPLHWQADAQLLNHQRSPKDHFECVMYPSSLLFWA